MAEGLVGGEGFAVDASLIRADADRQRAVAGSEGLPPDAAGRAVREYLAVLDDVAFGAATPVVPRRLAPTDPAARWTAASRDAVRPPQAHPQARSIAITRPQWRARRVPPRRNRPEPPQNGQAAHDADTTGAGLSRIVAAHASPARRHAPAKQRLLQHNRGVSRQSAYELSLRSVMPLKGRPLPVTDK